MDRPTPAWFRPSRAWRSWQAGQHLASRAIPTPRNLAFIAKLRRPFSAIRGRGISPHETYLVTIKEERSITLGDYVHKVLPTLDSTERRIQIRRLTPGRPASLLRKMHERSLSDRDLKASNLLILGDPSAPEIELSVIDLVGCALLHPLPSTGKIQNLARLSLSLVDVKGRTRTDALRFLRAYLPWRPHAPQRLEGVLARVTGAVQTKIDRNKRRDRAMS